MRLSNTARAIDTTIRDGTFSIKTGGTANGVTVSGGALTVSVGGAATGVIVNPNGTLNVESTGSAEVVFNPWQGTVTSNEGANITYLGRDKNVYYGDAVNGLIAKNDIFTDLTVNSGYSAIVYDSGEANNVVVNPNGTLTVNGGGTATIVFNPWQGTVVSGESADITYLVRDKSVYYGGAAEGLIEKDDSITELTVNAGYSAIVYDSGVMTSTTIAGGTLEVYSGGKVTGSLSIASGSVVSAYAGSILDFNISVVSAGGAALVNDLSLIQGTPDYTITVVN